MFRVDYEARLSSGGSQPLMALSSSGIRAESVSLEHYYHPLLEIK